MAQNDNKASFSRRKTPDNFAKALEEGILNIPTNARVARTQGLTYGDAIVKTEQTSMQRELARVRGTRSGTAADIATLNRKLSLHTHLTAELKADLQQARTKVPERKKDAAIVYGRVVNHRRLGLSHHVVELTKGGKRPLVKTITDDNGEFNLTIQGTSIPTPKPPPKTQRAKRTAASATKSEGVAVLLRVISKEKEEVHLDKKPMIIKANERVSRLIVIDQGKLKVR